MIWTVSILTLKHVTKDNAAAYLEFLRELTIKAHINELVISVDNYTPAATNAFYNIKEQGKVVDYVILMAYDEHYQGSEESGSVSSLEFVKTVWHPWLPAFLKSVLWLHCHSTQGFGRNLSQREVNRLPRLTE